MLYILHHLQLSRKEACLNMITARVPMQPRNASNTHTQGIFVGSPLMISYKIKMFRAFIISSKII